MAATTELLIDTANRSVVKVLNVFTGSVQETDVEKYAVQDKAGQIWALTLNMSGAPAHAGFIIGELVTTNDAKTGYVLDWNVGTGIVRVVASNSATSFATSTSVTGGQSAYARNISGASREAGRVSIRSLEYVVTPGVTLIIRWEATTNVDALVLAGSGTIGPNELAGAKITNPNGAGTTGDILFSTLGAVANSGYSVILELHKEQGFAQRPGY